MELRADPRITLIRELGGAQRLYGARERAHGKP